MLRVLLLAGASGAGAVAEGRIEKGCCSLGYEAWITLTDAWMTLVG